MKLDNSFQLKAKCFMTVIHKIAVFVFHYAKGKHVTFSTISLCLIILCMWHFCFVPVFSVNWVICILECNSACKTLIRSLCSFRENTLHALQQEGRNVGMRRPLVTEMVLALHVFAKSSSWNVVNYCTCSIVRLGTVNSCIYLRSNIFSTLCTCVTQYWLK